METKERNGRMRGGREDERGKRERRRGMKEENMEGKGAGGRKVGLLPKYRHFQR